MQFLCVGKKNQILTIFYPSFTMSTAHNVGITIVQNHHREIQFFKHETFASAQLQFQNGFYTFTALFCKRLDRSRGEIFLKRNILHIILLWLEEC